MVRSSEYSRIWETGWIDQGDSLGESSATGDYQTHTYLRLLRLFVEAASVEGSGDHGKSKDEDKSERRGNRSVGEEKQD